MHFGTRDIAWIIARITCGLLRATALEDRLVSRPDRPPAASSSRSAASPHAPRTAPSADRSAGTAGSKLAQMPTPADIAADIRRRPIGAVIADICRDLGIVPSNPLWREISIAVIANGGNLATLYKDINHRLFAGPIWRTAAEPSASPAVSPAFAVTPGTGPP
jgi:hypothetical protein